MSPPDLTVLVTCYNEAAFIQDCLRNVTGALNEVGCSYEVIVIDDASRDDSAACIRRFIEENPAFPVRLIANVRNRGLANNYVEAAFQGRGKYYRLCCGDDCEPQPVLVNVFKHLGEADMVIPCQDQKNVTGKSASRKLMSQAFTGLVNLISGYRIRYYNGMAIHLRYNVMRWHPSSYGFGFQADIITRLLDEGATYVQITSSSVDRKRDSSTALTTRNALSVAHTLLEIAIRRFRRALYGHTTSKAVEIEPKV